MCSLLTKLIGDPNRAEDITHDALILVLDRLRCEGIQKPNKLTSYVFSTAKFSFYGWLRKKDNQLELMDCLADVVFTEHPQESECMQVQASDTLKAQIQKLRVSRDRDILTRRYLGDQTKQEICEALTLTPEHYDRVISRARTRLKSVYLNQ
ncbi:MAG: sigma-70 family RNA polymerase sigma factor [Pseudomonadales bacterium]|nr:sigma-70 family RNA polymerase sigma factor [Pseudomonadales bacterium]